MSPPPPIPTYGVRRAAGRIDIDGNLSEEAWRSAPLITLQFPWSSQTGPEQRTTARLVWDSRNLYAGYECDDADIVARFTQRDDPTWMDDAVEIFINPRPSQSLYYGLEMNAAGTLYDYVLAFPAPFLKRYDLGGVRVAANVRGTLNQTGDIDGGWSLEVAVPWESFDDLAATLPPEPGSSWSVNLSRWDGTRPNRRLSIWSDSGHPKPYPHNPERFGQIVFRE